MARVSLVQHSDARKLAKGRDVGGGEKREPTLLRARVLTRYCVSFGHSAYNTHTRLTTSLRSRSDAENMLERNEGKIRRSSHTQHAPCMHTVSSMRTKWKSTLGSSDVGCGARERDARRRERRRALCFPAKKVSSTLHANPAYKHAILQHNGAKPREQGQHSGRAQVHECEAQGQWAARYQ